MNNSESSLIRWDTYFLNICNMVASNSKCFSRHLGAILVRDNAIISTGYNSPPKNIPDCGIRCKEDNDLKNLIFEKSQINTKSKCPRKLLNFKSGEGLEFCTAIHAEKNCLLSAAKNGIKTEGATIYLNAAITPCNQCFGSIINAGILEVVVKKINNYDSTVEYLIKNSNVKMREFK